MLTDIETDLAATRNAINRILLGVQSSTKSDGSGVRYVDLAALQQRERDLIAEFRDAERAVAGIVVVGEV